MLIDLSPDLVARITGWKDRIGDDGCDILHDVQDRLVATLDGRTITDDYRDPGFSVPRAHATIDCRGAHPAGTALDDGSESFAVAHGI